MRRPCGRRDWQRQPSPWFCRCLADVGTALARLHCHCQICQALYKQPRADVTIWWGQNMELPDSHRIQFKNYRLPPAINRGTCPACGMPVVGLLRLAPFVQLAFVPAINFPRGAALPRPSAHIFYHRRVKDVCDRLPKISGYWPSELYASRLVLAGMVGSRST